jgi:hypothetical protein
MWCPPPSPNGLCRCVFGHHRPPEYVRVRRATDGVLSRLAQTPSNFREVKASSSYSKFSDGITRSLSKHRGQQENE